jgi:flagellar biosynthesis/type III secretory pathway protein FliH
MKISERIAELEESVEALEAGIEEYSRLTDASLEVISLLLRRAAKDDPIDWAKEVDRLMTERETNLRRTDDVEMRWLAQMRAHLLSWHKLKPAADMALARGGLRLKTPRERLRILDGGRAARPPRSPTSRSGAPRKKLRPPR